MSSAYDQQIKKLIDHIQTLNQALHERNMQIVQWQQIARAVQDERARIARSLLDMLREALSGFATKFTGLRAENKKLRAYVEHQKQLHDVVARDMQGQLQYALTRIEELAAERGQWRDELASERAQWRNEVHASQGQLSRYEQEIAEKTKLVASQTAALAEMQARLEQAMQFAEMEEQYKAEMRHVQQEMATLKTQLASQDQQVAAKDREHARALETFEVFKLRANQEVQAMQAELAQARSATAGVDERVDEMMKLLANSEREVARLHKELTEERALHNEAKIRLEAATKDLRKAKTAVTKLEKAEKAAKGEQLGDLQKRLEEMTSDYKHLQEELASALRDKTTYMQALEGQKGKLRPLQPPAEGNQ